MITLKVSECCGAQIIANYKPTGNDLICTKCSKPTLSKSINLYTEEDILNMSFKQNEIDPEDVAKVKKILFDEQSWVVQKLSPKTFPADIMVKAANTSQTELKYIKQVRTKPLYRVKISKSRFYYGQKVEEAINRALRDKK